MIYILSFLIFFAFAPNAFGRDPAGTAQLMNVSMAGRIKINFEDVYAKLDPEKGTVVVSASIATRDRYIDNTLFRGRFSPTATAYLKPFNDSQFFSKFRTYAQIKCLDYKCEQLSVNVGIRDTLNNPVANGEHRFILYRHEIDRMIAWSQ